MIKKYIIILLFEIMYEILILFFSTNIHAFLIEKINSNISIDTNSVEIFSIIDGKLISKSKNTESEQDNNVVKDELWELLNGKITLKELPDKYFLDFDAVQKIAVKIIYYYRDLNENVCKKIDYMIKKLIF
mgnify:CR=1 FL=1